ncbi:unnamed protein product [Rotaria sp. Silwood2]|nr:unnamed protein product [Rotaria sp. Silwood2]
MNQVNQILHSTKESNNEAESATDDHHNDSSIVETKFMDTNDQSSSVLSRVEKKSSIMEQDIDGLEYSSKDDRTKLNKDLNDIFIMNRKKSKADIIINNHDKIYYQPFRKDFYTVVYEIAHMKDLDVDTYRQHFNSIKLIGKLCPRFLKTWSQCITSDTILKCLKKYKYEKQSYISTVNTFSVGFFSKKALKLHEDTFENFRS